MKLRQNLTTKVFWEGPHSGQPSHFGNRGYTTQMHESIAGNKKQRKVDELYLFIIINNNNFLNKNNLSG